MRRIGKIVFLTIIFSLLPVAFHGEHNVDRNDVVKMAGDALHFLCGVFTQRWCDIDVMSGDGDLHSVLLARKPASAGT